MNWTKEGTGSRESIDKALVDQSMGHYSRIDYNSSVKPTAMCIRKKNFIEISEGVLDILKIPEGMLDVLNSAKSNDESSDLPSHKQRNVFIAPPSLKTVELPRLASHKIGSKRKKVTFKYFPNPKEKFVAANSDWRSVSLTSSLDKAPQKPKRRRSYSIP